MKTIEIYCDGAALNNGCKNSIASYGIVMLLKGHGGNKYNEIADNLANKEAISYGQKEDVQH